MRRWNLIWLSLAALASLALAYRADARPPIVVAVVDTGLDISDPRFQGAICPASYNKDFTGTTLKYQNSHGSHVAGIILNTAGGSNPAFCLEILKYFTDNAPGALNLKHEVDAMRFAISRGASIINFSGGGPDANEAEYDLISKNPAVRFIVAAGNERGSAAEYYPCAYHTTLANVTCVGALNPDGTRWPLSNTGEGLEWEVGAKVLSYWPDGRSGYMWGSSQATATYTGKLLKALLLQRP